MSFNVTIKRSNLKQIINEVAKDIKIIKTRTSCGAALTQQLFEDKNSVLLTEGFWDSIQSGIGSAAGGVDKFLKKIGLKKEPEGYEQAQRIFAKIAEKEGHKVVQDLIKAIQDEARDAEAKLKTAKGGQQLSYKNICPTLNVKRVVCMLLSAAVMLRKLKN